MPENCKSPVQMSTHLVHFGTKTIHFQIHRAERKTLNIQVHPDGLVHVLAPLNADEGAIAQKVKQKAGWIIRQQDHFASFLPLTPPRKYVNGETHLYLGRQYQLRKVESENQQVKLYRGCIEVHSLDTSDSAIEQILQEWYKVKAREIFADLLAEYLSKHCRFQKYSVNLHVKKMPTRWGSCSPAGRITLNSELVKAPKACIEYVILHELCHLIIPSHNRKFYRLLSVLMPDWENWKARLERVMV